MPEGSVDISVFCFLFSGCVSLGVGEEQNLAAAADEPERLLDGVVGGDGDDGGVQGQSGRREAEGGFF